MSLFDEIEKQREMEKTGKVTATTEESVQEDNRPSTFRGKPGTEKVGVGKPPPTKRSIEEMDDLIKKKSRKSVVSKTEAKYEAKIFTLKQWMKDNYGEVEGDRPMEELDFRRFLVTGKDGKGIENANSIKIWRAAWGFWADIDPEFDIDFDPVEARRTKRLIKGLRYNAGEGQELDAADPIDSGRLWKMVDLLLEWGYQEYALFFLMVFYGGYRTYKTKGLMVKDIRKDTDKGTLIFTDRMKALQAGNIGKVGLKQNYKNADNITEFLEACMKDKGPEDPLFDVNEKKANDLLKRVAATHHWGDGKWVVYSLRHGMSLEAKAVLEGIPDMEKVEKAVEQRNLSKKMGHTNEESKKSYQNPKGKAKPQKFRQAVSRQVVVKSAIVDGIKRRK